MFLLSAHNIFYIILCSYVEGHVKKVKSEFHAFGWFPGVQNLEVFLENLLCTKFQNHLPAEKIPQNPLLLDFLIVIHML